MQSIIKTVDKNITVAIFLFACLLLISKFIYTLISRFSAAEPFQIAFICITYLLIFWVIAQKRVIFEKIVFLLVFLIPLGGFNIPVIRHYLPVETVGIYSFVCISMTLLILFIGSTEQRNGRRSKIIFLFSFMFILEAILSYWLSDHQIRQPFFSELRIWAFLCGIITFAFVTKAGSNRTLKDTIVVALFLIYATDVFITLLQQKFGTLASPYATMGIRELAPNIRYGSLTRSPGLFYASLINASFLGLMNIFFFCIYIFKIKTKKLPMKIVIFTVSCGFMASVAALGRTAFYGQVLCLILILFRQRTNSQIYFKRLTVPLVALVFACVILFFALKDTKYSYAIERILNIGSSVSELSQTDEGRPALILENLPKIRENLIFGAGPCMGHIESGYFTVLLRYGSFGFILFFSPVFFLLYRNLLKRDIRANSLGAAASWSLFFALTQLTLTSTFLGIELLMLFYVLMALASGRKGIVHADG